MEKFKDMYAEYNSLPHIDGSNDIKLLSGSESAGKTTITFSRKLVTCDAKDRDIKVSAIGAPSHI